MSWLKQFLKPNRWKVGLTLIFLLWAVFIPLLRMVIHTVNCSITDGITITCEGEIIELILTVSQLLWILSGLVIGPTIYPLRTLGLAGIPQFLNAANLPFSLIFIAVYGYTLSCFIYFLFSKIFKRKIF